MGLNLATKFAPVRENFSLAAKSGFQCAEIYTDPEFLQHVDEIVDTAKDFEFQYAMHFANRNDLSQQMLEDSIKLYENLNCSAMVIHGPQYRKYGEVLLSLLPSIRLAVENHHQRPDEIDTWANSSPWLTLDVEHIWKFTLGNATFDEMLRLVTSILNQHSAKLAHVHLPGYLPGFDEHRPMYCSRDFVWAILDLLDDIQFSGLIVSEAAVEFQNEQELQMDCLLFERWKTGKNQD